MSFATVLTSSIGIIGPEEFERIKKVEIQLKKQCGDTYYIVDAMQFRFSPDTPPPTLFVPQFLLSPRRNKVPNFLSPPVISIEQMS